MMYTSYAWPAFGAVWMLVHFLFVLSTLFSLAMALIWMARFANKQMLVKAFWVSLIIGILGLVITMPMAMSVGQNTMFDRMEDIFERNEIAE